MAIIKIFFFISIIFFKVTELLQVSFTYPEYAPLALSMLHSP